MPLSSCTTPRIKPPAVVTHDLVFDGSCYHFEDKNICIVIPVRGCSVLRVGCDDIEEHAVNKLREATHCNPQSIRVTLGSWDVNTSTMKASNVELLDVEVTDVKKTDTGISRP